MRQVATLAFGLVLAMMHSGVAARDCTRDDLRATFTPCETDTNEMYAVQYFADECTPTSDVRLMPPRPAQCDMPCQSGWFFSPMSNSCEECAPGTSSNSGGHIYRHFENGGTPEGFVTYCDPHPCNSWSAGDGSDVLTSGNQTGLRPMTQWGTPADQSVKSELVTVVKVINPDGGRFIFDYRVESEHYYDGLKVLLNGTQYFDPREPDTHDYRSRFLLSGIHFTWRHLEIPLPPLASTEVRLIYSKDRDQASLNDVTEAGGDRAYVRDITIEGVQMWAPKCTPCAGGTFSGAAAMWCTVCPKNTYSEEGATSCTPCDNGKWAPPGSADCITREACTLEDFVATYNNRCGRDGTRMRTWRISNASHCDPNAAGAVPLPAPERVPCAKCMKGTRYVNTTGTCERCPQRGMILSLKDNQCQFCPMGLAAVPMIDFDNGFDSFGSAVDPKFFTMKCEGECAACSDGQAQCNVNGAGFGLTSLHDTESGDSSAALDDQTVVAIQSESGNGGSFRQTLRYDFHSASSGYFAFRYFFRHMGAGRQRENLAFTAVVRFDNTSVMELNRRATRASPASHYDMYVDVGAHSIEFIISQDLPNAPADEVLFTLVNLAVSGDDRGAAWQCQPCQPGTYCPRHATAMVPCAKGYQAPSFRQTQCDRCPKDTVANRPGMQNCEKCPWGTTSTNGRHCQTSCTIKSEHSMWDLRPLRKVYYGPIDAATTDEPSSYFFSVCNFVNNASSPICRRRNGEDLEPSYACQHYSESRSYSLGVDPTFAKNAANELTLSLKNGDRCSTRAMRSTNITFICDPDAHNPGTLQFVREEPHCHYQFSLTSRASCEACSHWSYNKVVGQCNSAGKQEVRYSLKSNVRCAGGYRPAPVSYLSCDRCIPSYYESAWSECHEGVQRRIFTLKPERARCTDDGTAVRELTERYKFQNVPMNRTCHQVEVKVGANAFTFTTAVVFIIVFGLAMALVYAFTEMNKMRQAYDSLAAANATVGTGEEMRDVPRHVQDTLERQRRAGDDDLEEDGGSPAPAAVAAQPRIEDK